MHTLGAAAKVPDAFSLSLLVRPSGAALKRTPVAALKQMARAAGDEMLADGETLR